MESNLSGVFAKAAGGTNQKTKGLVICGNNKPFRIPLFGGLLQIALKKALDLVKGDDLQMIVQICVYCAGDDE